MIIHHSDLNQFDLGLKKPLKYSDEFTFIPLKININNNYQDCIIQTPKLFIPYGKQKLDNGKYILDLSFQNKINDNSVSIFLKQLKKIYHLIQYKFKKKQVNSFLKKTSFEECIRLKINLNSSFYDSMKQKIYTINSFTYGSFIIQLYGLWINDNNIWFQWYLLQGKLERPTFLEEYAFKDEINDEVKQTKYDKMKKMGVPIDAINLRKKLDTIPPPPPPPPNLKITKTVSKIKASDLQKVILKKVKPIKKKKIIPHHGLFEPPSLEELQTTLSKLKNIKKY